MTRCHRPTNEASTASSHPDTGVLWCATACTHTVKSFGYVQNFRWVSPAANRPLACSSISKSPARCHHLFGHLQGIYHTVAHGTLTRRSVTAT